MKTCPFFNKCGGCKLDFTSENYEEEKASLLPCFDSMSKPVWLSAGQRRRAEFCFVNSKFGFFEKSSKNVIEITACQNLVPEINKIIPALKKLPWSGAGSCLVTLCENGLDVAIISEVPYFSTEFKKSAEKLPVIRVSWNGKILKQEKEPVIKFGNVEVKYPVGAFLQPGKEGEEIIRNMVLNYAAGAKKVADLFCGIGNFTFGLNADGFDIFGIGEKRDLFKNPLSVGQLKKYDCVVMDPPRAGALAQTKNLAESNVQKIIYVSCNPNTFKRDADILKKSGYILKELTPVDQFVGSAHWELVAFFLKA